MVEEQPTAEAALIDHLGLKQSADLALSV
jgi:hypothetical protein